MSLDSFYGGKQGVSPIIKASFKFVDIFDPAYIRTVNQNIMTEDEAKSVTMDECFKRIDYTDVWYGELCIIDTGNRNDLNNGKLYRRTLKQSDSKIANTKNTRYAEYLGQLCGPSGATPYFSIGSIDTARKKAVGTLATLEDENAPLDNTTWEYTYINKDGALTHTVPISDSDQENWEQIGILNTDNNVANIQMVPGKEDDIYHDNIRYTWCNVRRDIEGKESDTWVYLGFEIPYLTFDVSWNEENSNYTGEVFQDRSDPTHPFYKKYEFHIPRGSRGIGPEEIFIVNPLDNNSEELPNGATLYTIDAIQYDSEKDEYIIDTEDTSKIKEISNNESYWVGKWCIYNPKTVFTDTVGIDTFYIYLGSYKDIREITLNEEGLLIFTYSDGTSLSMDNKIKWINSIELDNDLNSNTYGQVSVTYNTISNNIPDTDIFNLPLIKKVEYKNNGNIEASYIGENNSLIPQVVGNINSVKQFWVDPRGHLLGLYNSIEYRPADEAEPTSQDLIDGMYYLLTSDLNDKYPTQQNWVKGSTGYPIAADLSHWWHDLGPIKEVSGVRVAMLYSGTETTIENIITDLNTRYPNGLPQVGNLDWRGSFVVAKITISNGVKDFGTFFYNHLSDLNEESSWVYIGSWNGTNNIYFTDVSFEHIFPDINAKSPTIYFIDNTSANSQFNPNEIISSYPWDVS